MDKQRKVEPLEEYNVSNHLDAIKNGDFDLYENEYEIVKGSLGLPMEFMQLEELEQQMVLLYNDADFVEEYSGKHTKNNKFIAFLACYPNKNVVSQLFEKVDVPDGYDKDGHTLYKKEIRARTDKTVQRTRLKTLATAIWNKANLKEISKAMRGLVENDGYKDEELLERRIIDDSLSDERDSFTIQSRKMAMDIKGMKKPSSLQSINVFLDGGGEKANRIIVEESKNDAYDLLPKDEVEVVE